MATERSDESPEFQAIVTLIAWPLATCFSVLMYLPWIAFAAVVARSYWEWFVQPLCDLPAPRLFVLAGLLLLARLATYRAPLRDDTPEEKKVKHGLFKHLFVSLFGVAFFWLLGWVVHLLDGRFGS